MTLETQKLSRTKRRLSLIAMYGSYGLAVLVFWVARNTDKKMVLAFALPLVLFTFYEFWKLSRWSVPYALQSCGSTVQPDERQSAVRDKAMAMSFISTSICLLAGAFYMMLTCDFARLPRPTSSGEWGAVIWALVLFTATLPSAVLAWTEPDDDPEEALQGPFNLPTS